MGLEIRLRKLEMAQTLVVDGFIAIVDMIGCAGTEQAARLARAHKQAEAAGYKGRLLVLNI